MTPLPKQISEELLPYVQNPGQYIGREINQLVRDGDWERADVKVAIAFPDTYTIGMSHLGCQIIYWLCNHTDGVCAERVYCPWIDGEKRMRERGIPLFTWDTRRPAGQADIFAVSLQYEMGFTNLLTLLDLAGIPLRAADRDDRHPLVLAGGPQADNPEPVADFLDLVVIGDGEESMRAILACYKELKANGVRRRDMIPIMADRFPWLYAPSQWSVRYHEDGTIREYAREGEPPGEPARREPRPPSLRPPAIERCQTPDFEHAPFPTKPLVPYVEVVHDRIGIEIMRGCPQRCRFCHAGYTKRPVGVRSVDKLVSMAEEMYWATGHDEIGLLSLSTADYPHLAELADRINERFAPRHVNISMPSLRIDKMLQNIPWMARSVRKSGITVAAEAARTQMRDAIRKKVTDGNLTDGMREVFKAGWRRVKVYFMVGFPGETEDDVRGIWELSCQMSDIRRQLGKGPADISAAVSFLVPKPYTPFQWAAQPRIGYFQNARRLLAALSRSGSPAERKLARHVSVKTHDPARSILEAVFARGDRRLGATIEAAWRLGARFDGWDETFDFRLWQQAFDETGVDPDWYAHRERSFAEVLPWDHIQSGPRREYLEEHYNDVFVKLRSSPPQPGTVPLPIAV